MLAARDSCLPRGAFGQIFKPFHPSVPAPYPITHTWPRKASGVPASPLRPHWRLGLPPDCLGISARPSVVGCSPPVALSPGTGSGVGRWERGVNPTSSPAGHFLVSGGQGSVRTRELAHLAPLSILSVSRALWPWEPQLSGAVGSGICGVPCRCVCRDANWEILGPVRLSLGCSNTGLNAYPSPLILPRLWECRFKLLQNEPESCSFDRGFRSVALVVPGALGAC